MYIFYMVLKCKVQLESQRQHPGLKVVSFDTLLESVRFSLECPLGINADLGFCPQDNITAVNRYENIVQAYLLGDCPGYLVAQRHLS